MEAHRSRVDHLQRVERPARGEECRDGAGGVSRRELEIDDDTGEVRSKAESGRDPSPHRPSPGPFRGSSLGSPQPWRRQLYSIPGGLCGCQTRCRRCTRAHPHGGRGLGRRAALPGPSGGGRAPQVTSNSTLMLEVSGDLQEAEPGGVLGQFMVAPPTVAPTVDALRKAAVDRRVASVIIRPTTNAALWGKVQEIRDAILEFRKSRKPIVAYLEYGGDQSYYLATRLRQGVLMPTASLDLTGMANYEVFLRGALDKIGALPDCAPRRRLQDGVEHLHRADVHAGAPRDGRVAERRSLRTARAASPLAGTEAAETSATSSTTDPSCPRTPCAPGSSTTWPTRTRSTTKSDLGRGRHQHAAPAGYTAASR